MASSHTFDQLDTCFDDTHAVANAGLLLAATLAHNLLRWVAAIGAGRPPGAGGGQDAAPHPAQPARPPDPLRQTMDAASAGRLAVGGVVRAGTGSAALHRLRHLTHHCRTAQDPSQPGPA